MENHFSSGDKEINVAEIMKEIRRRISEKKGSVYTEEEIRDLAEMKLKAMIGSTDVESGLIGILHQNAEEWNISQEALYSSHPGFYGRLIRKCRALTHPILKLFANPDHVIYKQARLNLNLTHIVHNLVLELTRLNLEHNELRQRFDSLSRKIEWMEKRQQTVEKIIHPGKAENLRDPEK